MGSPQLWRRYGVLQHCLVGVVVVGVGVVVGVAVVTIEQAIHDLIGTITVSDLL